MRSIFTRISPKAGYHSAQQTGSLLKFCKIHLSSESKSAMLKKENCRNKLVTREVIWSRKEKSYSVEILIQHSDSTMFNYMYSRKLEVQILLQRAFCFASVKIYSARKGSPLQINTHCLTRTFNSWSGDNVKAGNKAGKCSEEYFFLVAAAKILERQYFVMKNTRVIISTT